MDVPDSPVLLEVCVGSAADVDAAVATGADRVELCAALELGGLTPSAGLIETVMARCPVPVVAMLRPRAGGFAYDADEFAAMLRDADRFATMGVAGFAFGVLDRQGRVDVARSREIIERAGPLETVFHRAFDFATDQRAAIDTLVDIGCRRVLTSGGKRTAIEGIDEIRSLIDIAAGRIEVLPGGGIHAGNVLELVRTTGCTQVHIGASGPRDDHSTVESSRIELCDARFIPGTAYRAVSCDAVAAIKAALRDGGSTT